MVWVGVGQFVAVVGSMAGLRVLTGVLDPNVYGELALGITVSTLAQQIMFGPLVGAFMRHFSVAQEQKKLKSYFSGTWHLCALATAAAIGVTAFVCMFLLGKYYKWIPLVVLASALSVVSGYAAAFDVMQNAARERIVAALHQGASQALRYVVAAGFVLWFGMSSSAAMTGFAIATLVILISQWHFFRKTIVPLAVSETTSQSIERDYWVREMWRYGRPSCIFGIFTWMQISSERWALAEFTNKTDVGLYATLYQIGFIPISLIYGLLLQILSPIIYEKAGDCSDVDRVKQSRRLVTVILIIMAITTGLSAIGSMVLHNQIFKLLAAAEYRSVSEWLPLMVLYGGIFACAQAISLRQMTEFDTRALMAPKVVTCLIAVGLNYFGAYHYGLRGVVFGDIIFAAIYLCWMIAITRKTL
jgi:O-antigen/teichoic acid export membrane protein